jgi:hypothetical protein
MPVPRANTTWSSSRGAAKRLECLAAVAIALAREVRESTERQWMSSCSRRRMAAAMIVDSSSLPPARAAARRSQ